MNNDVFTLEVPFEVLSKENANMQRLEAAARSQNKNSYNKSLKNALWLVAKCDALLKTTQVK